MGGTVTGDGTTLLWLENDGVFDGTLLYKTDVATCQELGRSKDGEKVIKSRRPCILFFRIESIIFFVLT